MPFDIFNNNDLVNKRSATCDKSEFISFQQFPWKVSAGETTSIAIALSQRQLHVLSM